jgi:hypothetical protein
MKLELTRYVSTGYTLINQNWAKKMARKNALKLRPCIKIRNAAGDDLEI